MTRRDCRAPSSSSTIRSVPFRRSRPFTGASVVTSSVGSVPVIANCEYNQIPDHSPKLTSSTSAHPTATGELDKQKEWRAFCVGVSGQYHQPVSAKAQTRNPKSEMLERGFGLRYSAFFRVSAFGIRIWSAGGGWYCPDVPVACDPAGPPALSRPLFKLARSRTYPEAGKSAPRRLGPTWAR